MKELKRTASDSRLPGPEPHPGNTVLTLEVPNTTVAKFANTEDPDGIAHNGLSHLDLQCLPFNIIWFERKFCLLLAWRFKG